VRTFEVIEERELTGPESEWATVGGIDPQQAAELFFEEDDERASDTDGELFDRGIVVLVRRPGDTDQDGYYRFHVFGEMSPRFYARESAARGSESARLNGQEAPGE
jgi:hypothetical protein